MNRLIIIGAGGYGHLVKDVATDLGYEDIIFLDDNNNSAAGKIEDYEKFADYENIIVAIGNPNTRKNIYEIVRHKFNVVSLVHPRAYVSKSAEIDVGCVIEACAVINSNAKVKKCSFINAGAVVNHDVVVNEFCQVDCGAVIAAGQKVNEKTKVESLTVYRGV